MPPQQLVLASNPEIAVQIFGDRSGVRKLQPVIGAKAPGMLARDLAETSSLTTARPRDPDPALAILDDAVDAIPQLLPKIVVLPTQKATGGSNPESSVRRTQQRNDVGVSQALARRRRPRGEADSVVLHKSGTGANPNVAVGSLRHRIWRRFECSVLHPPGAVAILSDSRTGIERPCRTKPQRERDRPRGDGTSKFSLPTAINGVTPLLLSNFVPLHGTAEG